MPPRSLVAVGGRGLRHSKRTRICRSAGRQENGGVHAEAPDFASDLHLVPGSTFRASMRPRSIDRGNLDHRAEHVQSQTSSVLSEASSGSVWLDGFAAGNCLRWWRCRSRRFLSKPAHSKEHPCLWYRWVPLDLFGLVLYSSRAGSTIYPIKNNVSHKGAYGITELFEDSTQ